MMGKRISKPSSNLFITLLLLTTASFGLTLNVKMNGADNVLNVEQGTSLSMSIDLNPGAQLGNNADLWMKVIIPGSSVYYLTPGSTWTTTVTPVYQGALVNLSNYFVASTATSALPFGTYVFVFGVDNNMDGVPDFHHSDSIRVTIAGIRAKLSLEGGPYLHSQSVKVTCSTSGANLYYTLNGLEPTQSSSAITNGSSISIGPGVTPLRVRAFKSGWTDGAIKTAIYMVGPKVLAQLNHSLALDTLGNVWSFGSNRVLKKSALFLNSY